MARSRLLRFACALRISEWTLLLLLAFAKDATGQVVAQLSASPSPGSNASTGAPLTLTLQDALKLARSNTPQFQAALTELGIAQQEKTIGRAGLLPSLNYNNQFIYTQPNQSAIGIRFIANNAVHEYVSQANVHEALSLEQLAAYRRASAAAALAKARAEIAERGLVATIVQAYYGLLVAERKFSTALRCAEGANSVSAAAARTAGIATGDG